MKQKAIYVRQPYAPSTTRACTIWEWCSALPVHTSTSGSGQACGVAHDYRIVTLRPASRRRSLRRTSQTAQHRYSPHLLKTGHSDEFCRLSKNLPMVPMNKGSWHESDDAIPYYRTRYRTPLLAHGAQACSTHARARRGMTCRLACTLVPCICPTARPLSRAFIAVPRSYCAACCPFLVQGETCACKPVACVQRGCAPCMPNLPASRIARIFAIEFRTRERRPVGPPSPLNMLGVLHGTLPLPTCFPGSPLILACISLPMLQNAPLPTSREPTHKDACVVPLFTSCTSRQRDLPKIPLLI